MASFRPVKFDDSFWTIRVDLRVENGTNRNLGLPTIRLLYTYIAALSCTVVKQCTSGTNGYADRQTDILGATNRRYALRVSPKTEMLKFFWVILSGTTTFPGKQ